MTDAAVSTSVPSKVLAWDGPTRLFKWALVVTVASAWISDKVGGGNVTWHVWNGQIVLVLVVFRLLWGLVGGETARFSSFLRWPGETIRYALALLRGREGHYLGHNPLGGWMTMVLIGLPAVMGLSGLFNADSDRLIIEGPLSARISDATLHLVHQIHHKAFDLLLIAIVLHLAAVAYHSIVKKERLAPAMITGRKPARDYVDMASATPGSIAMAIGCLMVAIVVVFGGVWLAK